MRKALFAVALVAASFAGGAAINGPGLDLARDLVFGPEAAVPAEGDLGTPTSVEEAPATPPAGVPSAPIPPLDLAAAGVAPAPVPPQPNPTQAVGVEPAELPALGPQPAVDTQPVAETPAPAAPTPEGWADAPGTEAPAVAVVPPPGRDDRAVRPAILGPADGPGQGDEGGAEGWAALRRRMAELGVSRYWIEGEPGGPARFRCLVPLAGGRAVAQHFEAEADDDLQAAEAALRRIALWRATEAAP